MKKINLLRVLAFSSLLLVGCGPKSGSSVTSGPSIDHSGEELTRYTESWRSVKTEGWGITANVAKDANKLEAALKLFDYMYSDAGNELMSYGPREFGYLAMDGDKVKTIDYQGKQVPQLSDGTLSQLKDLANNNYTNYYRYFVGATLPVGYVKEQGMEYQCTHEAGKEGLAKINKNIEVGSIQHPSVGSASGESKNVDIEKLAAQTTLNLSILYKQKESEPKFVNSGPVPNEGYDDPKGNHYSIGDWKPTWKALQNRLNIKFENTVAGSDVANNYTAQKTGGFKGIDIINAKASDFTKDGPGYFLDLNQYLDKMPNFKNFLDNNPIVKTTVTTANDEGKNAIYYAPYFDGFNDIERMTLVREDWLVKLLDVENPTFDTDTVVETKYLPTIEKKEYKLGVAASLENNEVKTITKNQKEKNIIEIQNKLEKKDGASLTNALRQYIKDVYGNQYAKPSDLFNGVDAAYDADEFIALLRCVKANPGYLNGDKTKTLVPFYPRANTNDRVTDIYRWAGHLWGVQGVESRCGFLYVADKNLGTIKDARGQLKTAKMLEKLHQIYEEGLILANFEDKAAVGGSGQFNKELGKANLGFATYDYCQTQTALNYEGYANGEYKLVPITGAFTNWENLTLALCPTTFKLTPEQSNRLTTDYVDLNQITTEKNKSNLWTRYVLAGFGGKYGSGDSKVDLIATPEAFVQQMQDWKVSQLENIYSTAYLAMID